MSLNTELKYVTPSSQKGSLPVEAHESANLNPGKMVMKDVQAHDGKTLTVHIDGDIRNHPIITVHALGIPFLGCFVPFFNFLGPESVMRKYFCVYHLTIPGHEPGADDVGELTIEGLASYVEDVRKRFQFEEFLGFGVREGASILLQYAAKYPARLSGLILVSPPYSQNSWTNWFWETLKAPSFLRTAMGVRDRLLQMYFCERTMSTNVDLVESYCEIIDAVNPLNMQRLTDAMNKRANITKEELKKLIAPTLVFLGQWAEDHDTSISVLDALPHTIASYVNVENAALMVQIENPYTMFTPIKLMLAGMGFNEPKEVSQIGRRASQRLSQEQKSAPATLTQDDSVAHTQDLQQSSEQGVSQPVGMEETQ
eukprot:GFYU01004235.1.p1 GENE.GFYU01004235.1~~GFYU01004235.1.p1  ORF type:complete len:385 (-),score=56.24 GFYU01004235.1:592-1698(-)